MDDDEPLLPDYAGACLTNVVPALLEPPSSPPAWLPAPAHDADQTVLLVLDGLGWLQLEERRHLAPTLASMQGGPITSVAPSTTSTALTSITTGLPPGEHGVVGYRIYVEGEVLNVLRWAQHGRDVRETVPPEKIQAAEAFLGHRVPVVTKTEFQRSGFTDAHLGGTRFHGYRVPSTLVTDVGRLVREHEQFVYCYYEGIDKVAHEYGLAEHYDAEVRAVDRLVGDLLEVLPSGATLVVTADHGQVSVGENIVVIDSEVMANTEIMSGEGRFRWFHAREGRRRELYDAVVAHHADHGWVATVEETIEGGWFGPVVSAAARARLGDVALLGRDDVSFHDPDDTGPFVLIGRHGSLTPAEMLVPLLAASA